MQNAPVLGHSPKTHFTVPRKALVRQRLCNFLQTQGNNWALGYLLNGPSCLEAVGDMLDRELEKCDMIDGLLTTMSLAGGTGSGVGTYLLR